MFIIARMSYIAVVNVIRDIANEINPTGLFTHGRRSDFSLENDKPFPQIHLLPFTGDVNLDNNYSETYSIQMLFLQQDTQDSNNEEREGIISEMDILSRRFVTAIFNADGVQVSNVRTEPNYRVLSATTSGYFLTFRLQTTTNPC